MDPEYRVAQRLANDARRVKTWVEVEKARLTGSGLPDEAETDVNVPKDAPPILLVLAAHPVDAI